MPKAFVIKDRKTSLCETKPIRNLNLWKESTRNVMELSHLQDLSLC